MCKECGCGHEHEHTHDHDNSHEHEHKHDHDPEHRHHRIVTLETKILSENDHMADANRRWLAEHAVRCVNLISSPGSGKTLLLEQTLESLKGKIKCAVITGDPQTDNDARRLSGRGAQVCQIQTSGACHLNAEQVGRLIPRVAADGVRLLFIENVGNLVCPSAFDLGESLKIGLLSVAEGEDKPLKYPALFTITPVVLITKTDLLPHVECSVEKMAANLRAVRPDVLVLKVSARSCHGMSDWIAWLEEFAA